MSCSTETDEAAIRAVSKTGELLIVISTLGPLEVVSVVPVVDVVARDGRWRGSRC
jgi:hypothetical protein